MAHGLTTATLLKIKKDIERRENNSKRITQPRKK